MMAARVVTAPTFSVLGRDELFADEYSFALAPHANYDVSRDDKRFLMIKNAQTPELLVVYGWLNELKARMAGRP